jgi:antitoxin MazE
MATLIRSSCATVFWLCSFYPETEWFANECCTSGVWLTNVDDKCIFIVDTIFGGPKMKTRVQKWGNSLALRIPKSFADEAGLKKEMPVEVSLKGGNIVITPIARPKLTLEELLAKVTEDNLHSEVDYGPPVGNEVW